MKSYWELKLLLAVLMLVVLGTGVASIYAILGTNTPEPQALVTQGAATPVPRGTQSPPPTLPPTLAPVGTTAPSAPGQVALQPAIPAPTVMPGVFGIFDPSGNLASYSKYLVATLILIVTVTLEMFLVIMWGALFVNDEANVKNPLGLPIATVRVFLILLVILVIILFTLLPDQWGSNKAVVLLFGLLSTIIGFYFGNRASAEVGAADVRPVRLALDAASKAVKSGTVAVLKASLQAGYKTRIGASPTVVATLLDPTGVPTTVQLWAITDSEGRLEFKLDTNALAEGSYLVHVLSPFGVQSEDRISVAAAAGAPVPGGGAAATPAPATP